MDLTRLYTEKFHGFKPNSADITKCLFCNRIEKDHTDAAECEICGKEASCRIVKTFLMCQECAIKEMELVEKGRQESLTLFKTEPIDSQIAIQTDIFNAKIQSIAELKVVIDSNPLIPAEQKDFTFAKECKERFIHIQTVIFKLEDEKSKLATEQRAFQVTLNNLANKLRAEEREKLQIADINYKPQAVLTTKPKVIKTKKFDKAEISAMAKKYNLPEAALQMVVVAKGLAVEDAAKLLSGNMTPKE